MTTIAVYFDEAGAMGYPFNNENYFLSYADFSKLCTKNNVQLVIVRGNDSYLGKMQFSHGWKFEGEELIEHNQPIRADVIYAKGQQLVTRPGDVVVNHPEVGRICRDKLATYELFHDQMAPTFAINAQNWQEVIQQITTNKVVLKPRTGMEGTGIVICEARDFNYEQLDKKYEPYLAQEFLDGTAGIPGVVTGAHDLRVYVFNGEVKLANYRQPKVGGLLANVAQGGSLTILSLDQLPSWVWPVVQQIDAKLALYGTRIYSIDLMYANNKPYLIELNSRPGFPYRGWSYYDDLHRYVLETLLTV